MDSRGAQVFYIRCSIRYSGRIDAELELGDRIFIVFHDGAAIVHALGDGVKPKNWMPSGTQWKDLGDTTKNIWVGEHQGRSEKLEIYVEDVWNDMQCFGTMHGRLIKLGSEREMSDLIADDLDLIELDLQLVEREYRTPVGPIDILAVDRKGNPVALEVKRARVTGVEVPYQLLRYLDSLRSDPRWADTEPRGHIVAPGIGRVCRAETDRMGLGFIRLDYANLISNSP